MKLVDVSLMHLRQNRNFHIRTLPVHCSGTVHAYCRSAFRGLLIPSLIVSSFPSRVLLDQPSLFPLYDLLEGGRGSCVVATFYCEEGVSLGDKRTQLQMYAERLEKLVLNCNAWRAKVEGAAGYWTAQRHKPHIHH